MTRLVFFCGHSGTGKTTLAKRLIHPLMQRTKESFCFLDKDTLYGQYSSAVMGALTGNPNDRDSAVYLQHLRNPEYQGLLDTARENLALQVNTLVVGPLSQEIKGHYLKDHQWLGVDPRTAIHIVWVSIDEALAYERIKKRGIPADDYKLEHWEEYRQRRFDPDPATYPELILFDNTAPTQNDIEHLLNLLC